MKKLYIWFLVALTILIFPCQATAADKEAEGTAAGAWSYRSQLGETEAAVYDAMSQNFQGGTSSFTYQFPEVLEYDSAGAAQTAIKDLAFRAYEAFYRDNPQVFWVGKDNITITPEGVMSGNKIRVPNVGISVNFTNISGLDMIYIYVRTD